MDGRIGLALFVVGIVLLVTVGWIGSIVAIVGALLAIGGV